jgi:hypothetical protein
MSETRNAYNILVGKPEGKTPYGRPRRGWEDNIRLDLKGIMWRDVIWMHMAEDRDRRRALLNTVIKLCFP